MTRESRRTFTVGDERCIQAAVVLQKLDELPIYTINTTCTFELILRVLEGVSRCRLTNDAIYIVFPFGIQHGAGDFPFARGALPLCQDPCRLR